MTKLTDLKIQYLVGQARGTIGYPKETLGQMAARWGVTERRLWQLLRQWRAARSVPRLNPRRRPLSPPSTQGGQALIEAKWHRAPRGAHRVYQALK